MSQEVGEAHGAALKRRDFLGLVAASGLMAAVAPAPVRAATRPPNILWISCEDMSPDLPCYGNDYSIAPNLERLASQGVRYTHAYSHAPVCAPSRSGIITGMYPTTIGTHQMRCKGVPQPEVKCFTEYLRAAGYYCTNRSKTDYQFDPPLTAWDECGDQAHRRGRAEGQPFFAVINFTVTHESQVRSNGDGVNAPLDQLRPEERHDPAKATLPPYYPDTPPVRADWAQYHDTITLMDRQAGEVLRQLEEDGLADNTIVWFWGDHGRGLPRGKRWLYDSGVHVPLIVRVPERYRDLATTGEPGSVNDELVSFIDFAPTMLSLAGLEIPRHLQGQAFLGPKRGPKREYVYGVRDRMDEAYDMMRSVRDSRYKYIRNYMPHLPYSQDNDYGNRMPTMQEMRRLHAEGKLAGPQQLFFRETKPVEELYDTQADPHEIDDLAGRPEYRDVLERMRRVHLDWVKETRDIGLIPEPEFDEMKRPGGVWRKTASPQVNVSGGGLTYMQCPTEGASIAYREDGGPWRLYVGPDPVKSTGEVKAKACRLGYLDSDEVGPSSVWISYELRSEPHWRDQVYGTDLLERLRAIKALDGRGAEAVPDYLRALEDAHASVRYWGVVGLRVAGAKGEAEGPVRALLEDASPVVRIAAAETLCGWDGEEKALPVLMKELKSPADTVRLHAATALGRIGEKARPALPLLRATMTDKYEYVTRVTKYTLARMGEAE